MIVRNTKIHVYQEKHQKVFQAHVKILMSVLIISFKTLVKQEYKEIVFGLLLKQMEKMLENVLIIFVLKHLMIILMINYVLNFQLLVQLMTITLDVKRENQNVNLIYMSLNVFKQLKDNNVIGINLRNNVFIIIVRMHKLMLIQVIIVINFLVFAPLMSDKLHVLKNNVLKH